MASLFSFHPLSRLAHGNFCPAQRVGIGEKTNQRGRGFGGDIGQRGHIHGGNGDFIAVVLPLGRTRAHKTRCATIGARLQRARRQGLVFRQRRHVGGNIGNHPMHPAQAGRRVFIVHRQHKTFRALPPVQPKP